MDKKDLQKRTKQFALRVFKLTKAMPKTFEANVVRKQIIRSASSVAANYRATCCARSRAEFIAKLGIVEEEADETLFWLEMIIEAEMMKKEKLQSLFQEAREILAIIIASKKSARRNKLKIGN